MSPKLVQTYPLTVQKQEIDIMRKSSPINLRFTVLPLSKPKWHFFSGAVS